MFNYVKQQLKPWYYVLNLTRSALGICLHAIHKDHQGKVFGNKIHSIRFPVFQKFIKRASKVAKILPAEEFMKRASKGETGITTLAFDDAYKAILDDAIPYLVESNIPATIFVNSSTLNGDVLWRDKLRLIYDAGLIEEFVESLPDEYGFTKENIYFKSKTIQYNSATIDKELSDFVAQKGLGENRRLYMSAEELRSINKEEMISIGNHTRNHYLLSSLTQKEQEEEIWGGHNDLEDFGLEVSNVFAAPFGGYETINSDTVKVLEEGGYEGLLLTNGEEKVNWNRFPCTTNLTVANRFLPKIN